MKKPPCPSEHQEQAAFFRRLEFLASVEKDSSILLAYAVPNGGKRGKVTAKLLKDEGAKAGVPDVVWPVARYPFHGLYLEFKKQYGGSVDEDQRHYLESLMGQGYLAVAVKGYDAAILVFELYRKLSSWDFVMGTIAGLPTNGVMGPRQEAMAEKVVASCGRGVFRIKKKPVG